MGKLNVRFLAGVVLGLALHSNAQSAVVSGFTGEATPIQAIGDVPAQPDSIVAVAAESQGLLPIAREDLPRGGTYWWVQPGGQAVPTPFPSTDMSQAIYQITDGQFLVDQTGGAIVVQRRQLGSRTATDSIASAATAQADAVVNLISQVQDAEDNRQMRSMMRSMGMDDEEDSGGSDSPMFSVIDTNSLWLEITNVSNGWSYLNLHNATNLVYAIESTTNLLTSWNVETELWPTGDQTNVMPFMVQNFGRQDLFFRAQDWTGVDSDSDGIPDWWAWKYFGNINVTDTNLDYSGNNYSFAYEFSNSIAPTVFKYTGVAVTNNYVNSTTPLVQLDVAGSPYYVATLVDDGNFSNAVWNTFSGSSVTANLGSVQGWHEVWIGLRGHADAAGNAVWQRKRLKLDWTPPALIITNPTNDTVDVPMIQLQGFSPEALSSICYDLTNALGLVTNQQVLVLNQSYDTTTWEFTTNTFQAFDVMLTNGANTFTLHATDLAGNVTTLVTNFTLDYLSKTNAPIVQITWPQNGMKIAGNTVTVRGQLADATAKVSATVTDTNGNTNTFSGMVERTGRFWLDNLPLSSGTNTVTLTVKDAADRTNTTSFNLVQDNMVLTLATISDLSQLWQPTINLTGYVSDPTATIYVNGVLGTNDDGYWRVDNVPNTIGGVAIFDLKAVPAGGGDPDTSINLDKPSRVFLLADAQKLDATTDHKGEVYENANADFEADGDDGSSENQTWINYNHVWLAGWGGSGSEYNNWQNDYWDWQTNHSGSAGGMNGNMAWNWTGWGEEIGTYNDGTTTTGFTNALWVFDKIGNEHCNVNDPVNTNWDNDYIDWDDDGDKGSQHDTYTRTADSVWHVQTGGRAIPQRQNLWQFSGSAWAILNKRAVPPFSGVTMNEITNKTQIALGSLGNLKADGNLWLTLPDDVEKDITPYVAGNDFYTFNVSGQEYPFYIGLTTSTANANLNTDTPEVCVGQQVTLGADWQGGIPPYANVTGILWHLPDNYVNQQIDYSTNCTTYVKNIDLLTNTAVQCWYVNLPGGTCSVQEALHFSNGQTVSIAAAGSLTIFRPKVYFRPDGGANVVLDTNGLPSIYLGVGDNSVGAMGWKNTINLNPNYPAAIYYTQLIYRDWDWNRQGGLGAYLPKSIHTDNYLLDTEIKYSAATIINNSGSNSQLELHFGDGPDLEDNLHSFADCHDKFETYLEFQPLGGIPITLGVIKWEWQGRVDGSYSSSTWSLTTNSITGPSFYDYYDNFPEWPYVYTGN